MATKYFALLTNIGAAKLANATALGAQVEITQMAVGDGNGVLPTPNPAQTALTHELRRAQLNMLTIDPVNTNQIIAEQVIPEDAGGWWIREIGLFDKDGDMIAVANCAETYKPQLQEGSGRVQVIRVILIVSSTEAVTLKIDPSVVLATRKYVDDAVIEVKAYADDVMKKHVAAANPHKQYPLIANALKEMVDAGLVNQILENLGLGSGLTGVVGAAINARMSVTAPSATATFTADELIVGVALGGLQYRLGSFNKTINLATTGAGGMDTGTAPVSGYVALYAIYNPTTAASAMLAVNATAAVAPQVYGGANMPAGYTASALISVWPTSSGSQFLTGSQVNRNINTSPTRAVLATSTQYPAGSTISIATLVPPNAVLVSGSFILTSSETSLMSGLISSDSLRSGEQGMTSTVQAFSAVGSSFSNISITTSRMAGISLTSSTGTPSFSIYITCYTF